MMNIAFLSNPKWFWFFWIAGAISILFYLYQYQQGKHLVVNLDIYRTAYLRKIGGIVLLLVLAFGLKYLGKMSWATALLALVLAFSILRFVLALAAMVLTGLAFYIGGAK